MASVSFDPFGFTSPSDLVFNDATFKHIVIQYMKLYIMLVLNEYKDRYFTQFGALLLEWYRKNWGDLSITG